MTSFPISLKQLKWKQTLTNELFEQQTIKANEFFNKALTETDQQKRDEYIASAQKLKQQASEKNNRLMK